MSSTTGHLAGGPGSRPGVDRPPGSFTGLGAGIVGFGLILATLVNGASTFLKRVGLVEATRYESYWRIHCAESALAWRPWGLGRRCIDSRPGPLDPDRYRREEPYFRYVFEIGRGEIPLKLGKDVLVAAFLAASLVMVWRRGAPIPGKAAWPLWAFCGWVVAAMMAGFASGRWLSTVVGLRGMTFLGVALLGAWLTETPHLERVSRALVILCLLEVALVPVELLWGMPISGYSRALSLPNRVAGTLVKPNTLGILAAATVAMAESFESTRMWRRLAWGAGMVLVAAAGSGTGWILLFCLAVYRRRSWLKASGRMAALLLLAAVLVWALPTLVGRPGLFESVVGPAGRLGALRDALAAQSGRWIGGGLGTRPPDRVADADTRLASLQPRGEDSTLTSVIKELGIPAAALLYLALAFAWAADTSGRPLLLALGLGSLTLNLAYAFPMNVLLGVAFAGAFARPDRHPGA
jgi:hypothetical protein